MKLAPRVLVAPALVMVALMHLILLTGLLQVSLATDAPGTTDATTALKSASSDKGKQVGNVKLASFRAMNLSAKLSLPDNYNCTEDNGAAIFKDCIDVAKEKASITEESEGEKEFDELLDKLINSENETDRKRGCKGLHAYSDCSSQQACTRCSYPMATMVDFLSLLSLYNYDEKCKENIYQLNCPAAQWKEDHKNEDYWGECVPDEEKLKCVKKADPEATDWEVGMFKAVEATLEDGKKHCPTMLEVGQCELKAGCDSCNANQFANLGSIVAKFVFFPHPETHKTCFDYGIEPTKLNDVCPKFPTVVPPTTTTTTTTTKKPTTTSTKKPETRKKSETDAPTSTESDITAIIIVVAVLAVVIVVVSILAYCFCCAGGAKEKKPAFKQQPKQMAPKGAPSSSKMDAGRKSSSNKSAPGKSSSVSARGATKSQVSGAKVSGSKMGASKVGSKVVGSKMGASKSLA